MVKEIITTTAFIAASVAMANAASLVYYNSFDNITTTVSSITNEYDGTTVTSAFTDNGTAISLTASQTNSYSVSDDGWMGKALNSPANNRVVLSGTTNLTSETDFSVSFHVKVASTASYPVLMGIGTTNNNVKLNVNGSGQFNLAPENLGTISLVEGQTRSAVTLDGWTHIVLTGKNKDSGTGMDFLLYVNGVATQFSGTTSLSTYDVLTLGGRPLNTNNTSNAIFDDLAIYSGVLTQTEVSSLMSASAIPEPSMFGLLAGLGALALVGARRRRK